MTTIDLNEWSRIEELREQKRIDRENNHTDIVFTKKSYKEILEEVARKAKRVMGWG